MTADLFMPFTHLKPHLFDMLMSVFLPSDYRTNEDGSESQATIQ